MGQNHDEPNFSPFAKGAHHVHTPFAYICGTPASPVGATSHSVASCPTAFRCPQGRWPLQRFHNDQKPKCNTYHWSSTPNAGTAHDLRTPPVSGPTGETVTLTILTSLWCPKGFARSDRPANSTSGTHLFDHSEPERAARLVAPCQAVGGSPCPTSCNLSHGFFNVLDYREAAHLPITGSTTHTNIVERNV